MAKIFGPPANAIRNQRISKALEDLLIKAADAAGVERVVVTSGGQPAKTKGERRIGSTRHDHGAAADCQLERDGNTVTFTDQHGGPIVEAFVEAAAAYGATGIGAGIGYMGNSTLHVGFGTSPRDHSKVVWGAGGRSETAPRWLRSAAERGWQTSSTDSPEVLSNRVVAPASPQTPGRFVVVAREGLRLRNGPGLEFAATTTLNVGTPLTVAGFDGANSEWARVDLENDGQVDGHVLAAFLSSEGIGADQNECLQEPTDKHRVAQKKGKKRAS